MKAQSSRKSNITWSLVTLVTQVLQRDVRLYKKYMAVSSLQDKALLDRFLMFRPTTNALTILALYRVQPRMELRHCQAP